MATGCMTKAEAEAYTRRLPGERGGGRRASLQLPSVKMRLASLAPRLGVSQGQLSVLSRALDALAKRDGLKKRRAPPLLVGTWLRVRAELWSRREAEPRVLAAALLAWAAALRLADLRSLRRGEVQGVPGMADRIRITWWRSKEARLRGAEVPMEYALPRDQAEFVLRVTGGPELVMFPRACLRRLMEVLRGFMPEAREHSWKRGALQELSRQGGSWAETQALGRHRDLDTTRLYLAGAATPDLALGLAASRRLSTTSMRARCSGTSSVSAVM
eukprot:Rhum_TRINITY_DN14909_c5_g2::Rhum_TRINITY_DN14909_c5_g2_i1::g.127520::m.127520